MSNATSAERPCRVLLIEDDPDDVFLFQRALGEVKAAIGREVVLEHAGDGLEASYQVSVDDLMNRLPDVLALDLNMPRMDGVKFLHALRATFALADLPVVVLTTSTAKRVHEEALAAGADAVFVKPDSAAELNAIVRAVVERGEAYAKGRG